MIDYAPLHKEDQAKTAAQVIKQYHDEMKKREAEWLERREKTMYTKVQR